jgi:hypothetical protein
MRLKHLTIAVFVLWPVMFAASANAWTITVTGALGFAFRQSRRKVLLA